MYNVLWVVIVIFVEFNCIFWVLDCMIFWRILMELIFVCCCMYEGFFEEVFLFLSFILYECFKIVDVFKSEKFLVGYIIICEGDLGDFFYLFVDGEVVVFRRGDEIVVKYYKKGDFFGEFVLFNDVLCVVSVVSIIEVKVVLFGKLVFQWLLGLVESIMWRIKYVGVKIGVEEMDFFQMV